MDEVLPQPHIISQFLIYTITSSVSLKAATFPKGKANKIFIHDADRSPILSEAQVLILKVLISITFFQGKKNQAPGVSKCLRKQN